MALRGTGRVDGGGVAGAGFAITEKVVITAGHVVRGKFPGELTFRPDSSSESVDVKRVDYDEDRDIAILHLRQSVETDLKPGSSSSGDSWYVDTSTAGAVRFMS